MLILKNTALKYAQIFSWPERGNTGRWSVGTRNKAIRQVGRVSSTNATFQVLPTLYLLRFAPVLSVVEAVSLFNGAL
jgi:hypothetical protein